MQCRFGSAAVGGSAVSWSSSTMVSCVTPGAADGRTGPVTVELSINDGADFTSDGKMYMYEMGVTVSGLMPSWGRSKTAGQVVTVIGSHFEQSQELSCQFGLEGQTRGVSEDASANRKSTAPAVLLLGTVHTMACFDVPSAGTRSTPKMQSTSPASSSSMLPVTVTLVPPFVGPRLGSAAHELT